MIGTRLLCKQKKFIKFIKMNKNLKLTFKGLRKIWYKVPPDFYSQVDKNPLQSLWHGNKLKCIKQSIYKKPKNVLDAGCADGSFLDKMTKFYPEAEFYGIDCYFKAIKYGKNKYPHLKLKVADVHKLPFKDKFFDLIILAETLEHVVDPIRAMKELKRILKDDGIILVELDSGSILFKLLWFFWTNFLKGKVWKDSHLHHFNVERLEALFKKCRLKIVTKKFFNLGMAFCFTLKKL